jgi:hypothetical protein
MKRTLLATLTLGIFFFACSKSPAPSPAIPTGPGNGTHDTTPAPPKQDTTPQPPPPPTETPGKSVVVSMYEMTVFLDNSKEYDAYGIGYFLRVVDKDTSHYSAEIINAYKGTCTIDYVNDADSDVVYHFSNYYQSKTGENATVADTSGLLQFHVYRKDGKNIKTGVKDIYMMMQTYPANIVGQGTVLIEGYAGNRRNLTLDSLVQIISRRATLTLLNSDGF